MLPDADATVDIDGDLLGETDANGTWTFDSGPSADDSEIESYVGGVEIESAYVLKNGSLANVDTLDEATETETETVTETETETESATETEPGTPTTTPMADDVALDATLDDGRSV